MWELKSVWEKLSAKVGAQDEAGQETLEVFYHSELIRHGESSSIATLVALSNSRPYWRRPAVKLSEHFSKIGEYAEAERWAGVAIERASAKGEHTNGYSLLIMARNEYRGLAASEVCALTLLEKCLVPESRASISETVAKLFAKEGDADDAAYWYERAVAEKPEDADVRFNAAYEMSRFEGYHHLSYFHYRALEKTSPSRGYVLNNLAYTAASLGEDVLLGDYVERAISIDKEWATANKAIKFAEVGFLSDASRLLDDLGAESAKNERVIEVRKFIESTKASQELAREKLDAAALPVSRFSREAVAADAARTPNTVEAGYVSGTQKIKLSDLGDGRIGVDAFLDGVTYSGKISRNRFGFKGIIEEKERSNRAGLLGAFGLTKKEVSIRRTSLQTAVALTASFDSYNDKRSNFQILDLSAEPTTRLLE